MTPLEDLLLARVRQDGPLTFRDFMAQALYHPDLGYYTTGKPWKGRGDFTTAPAYGPHFATALARFALACKDAVGPGPFEVVEVGSGSGRLAAQLAPRLAEHGVRFRSVDVRRPPLLPATVPWTASVRGLEVRGLVFSNELFDALPVHLVAGTAEGLREAWVAEQGGRLVLQPGPVSRPDIDAYLTRFGLHPEPGHQVEVNLDALSMLRDMATALRAGCALTIDYGHAAKELAAQPAGTLTAFREHRVSPDPLATPGEQDLTAHVNFTALAEEGRGLGFDVLADVPQWEFLAAQGILRDIALGLQGPATLAEALAAKSLIAPGRMGDFRVLLQAKGLPPAAHARLARRATADHGRMS